MSSDGESSRFAPEKTARLHWNESPWGPPPAAVARITRHAAQVHLYPAELRTAATKAFAAHMGVADDTVLLTCGVDEAIDLALAKTQRMWHVVPGFTGYHDRARVLGVTAHAIRLDASFLPPRMGQRLGPRDTVFAAQPHNPTANLFPPDWLSAVLESGAGLFLDETYANFCETALPLEDWSGHPRLVRFHSLSKAWGLAGLRIGALIGTRERIAELSARQRFQSADTLALHGLLGALDEPDWLTEYVRHVRDLREEFRAVVAGSAVFDWVLPSQANFFAARCIESCTAAHICRDLLNHRVRVYDCAALGMPRWVRISIGAEHDLMLLQKAILQIPRRGSMKKRSPPR